MSLAYKEIHETFDSLARIKDLINGAEQQRIIDLIRNNKQHIIYVGCGSSYSLSKSLARITRMHANNPSFAVAGGDLLLHAQSYAKLVQGAIVVFVSRSGSTSELMLADKALKTLGCGYTAVSIVCKTGSDLKKISEYCIEMPWAFDNSICQTRTVTSMFYAVSLIIALASNDGQLEKSLDAVLMNGLEYMSSIEGKIKEIANKNWTKVAVLADAQISGIGEEAALAYKEICQLPSNFYNVLDSRHGPMVLFNDKTLVCIALSNPATEYERALVSDVIKKGCEVVVYADTDNIEGANCINFGQHLEHTARGIPFILLNQLLSCYKAEYTGVNPDEPSGLTAWIEL